MAFPAPAQLERPNGLKVLELEIDLPALVTLRRTERRADDRTRNSLARRADVVQRRRAQSSSRSPPSSTERPRRSDRLVINVIRGGKILDRQSKRLEQRDLLRDCAGPRRMKQQLADLADDVIVADRALLFREQEIARFVESRFPRSTYSRAFSPPLCRARA